MKKLFLVIFLGLGSQCGWSQGGDPIGKTFEVTCQYEGEENFRRIGMKDLPAKGEYHYDAYLPMTYEGRSQDLFPVLFVMMPGGNARLDKYISMLEKTECIGIALKEAKNGDYGPIMGNFLAAHDEAMTRFRIDPERKFATGFSGGARGSSLFTQMREGFAGLILQGAAYWFDDKTNLYSYEKSPKGIRVYLLVGKEDKNNTEIERMKKEMPKRVKYKIELIEGGHKPSPEEKVMEALEWVMQKGEEAVN